MDGTHLESLILQLWEILSLRIDTIELLISFIVSIRYCSRDFWTPDDELVEYLKVLLNVVSSVMVQEI